MTDDERHFNEFWAKQTEMNEWMRRGGMLG